MLLKKHDTQVYFVETLAPSLQQTILLAQWSKRLLMPDLVCQVLSQSVVSVIKYLYLLIIRGGTGI